MKKIMIFFAWMLAACPMAILGQTHYLESLTLENSKVEKVGRSVRVSADIRLDAVELNMAIEEAFGTSIPDEELPNMKTVGDIFNYLTNNG